MPCILLSLLALIPIFLNPVDLGAQQRVKAAYASISPNFAGLWVAKEAGAFEKNGLAADLVYIASGSVTVQALMGGDVHLAIGASNAVVSAILRGAHWWRLAAWPTGRGWFYGSNRKSPNLSSSRAKS